VTDCQKEVDVIEETPPCGNAQQKVVSSGVTKTGITLEKGF
jgi:hypothetical protein